MKITMNINDDLLSRVDNYARANYLTRTSVFSMAVSQFLLSQELPTMMANLNNAMLKIAETGEITEEQQKAIDMMDALCTALNAKN